MRDALPSFDELDANGLSTVDRVCESCIVYCVALKSHLREEPITEEELGGLLDWDRIEELNGFTCPPFIAANQLNDIVEDVSILPDNPAIAKVVVDTFVSQVEQLLDSIGKCEQIKDTPMVFGYVATLRSFLMLWLITLPLALIGEYGWIATPAMALITFLFLNVEQMAVEIEQPFGERRGGDLHAPLVRGVNLQVVPVRAVQAQEAVGVPLVVVVATRVHAHAEVAPQELSLVLPEVRQHAAEFQNQQRLRHALLSLIHI